MFDWDIAKMRTVAKDAPTMGTQRLEGLHTMLYSFRSDQSNGGFACYRDS